LTAYCEPILSSLRKWSHELFSILLIYAHRVYIRYTTIVATTALCENLPVDDDRPMRHTGPVG
jgi:hypothetical protein